jgi:hypothetical protein
MRHRPAIPRYALTDRIWTSPAQAQTDEYPAAPAVYGIWFQSTDQDGPHIAVEAEVEVGSEGRRTVAWVPGPQAGPYTSTRMEPTVELHFAEDIPVHAALATAGNLALHTLVEDCGLRALRR